MATLITAPGLPPPKTIRFVNNAGQPPQKRRRINAACLTCRKRKTRCAGEHPTCSTCAKNGHVCLGYTDAVDKKRDFIGAATGPDGNLIDADDDYLDDEIEDEHRHWRGNRNGDKQHAVAHDYVPSRRKSEPGPSSKLPSEPPKSEVIDWEERHAKDFDPARKFVRRPTNARNESFSTEDGRSPKVRSPVQHQNESNRVPYFRYFGPTAIVPGFKQMVVKVRDRRRSSMSATSPGSGSGYAGFMTAIHPDHDMGPSEDMPVYDYNDSNPVHPIILSLVDTFFVHLGCNYPFLNRNKFPMLVRERRVEPILVDAVCALAARFSELSVFTKWNNGKHSPADYGHVYAQRAKSATVDTFPCPSVAAVQACLLMAYEGFGADQDSALWMYLGLAIRMAIDLGLHKKDGVRYQGEKDPWFTRSHNRKPGDIDASPNKPEDDGNILSLQEQKELEQERIDTLWSVYILDRVISSGTGRPVTFRDDDFELELPKASVDVNTGWPDPYPTLIQIIHLYGRVSDVLNNIMSAKDLTQNRINRLVQMEIELTKLHQKQDPRLRFDANNFKTYVSSGQGTTFILLHLWFHALIIVLHQPTLLAPLEKLKHIHELVPHSRELSMSSAKTIADILAFAKLIDAKSFVGNPFTSQPIYIAACAWIGESFANVSQPVSRSTTPPPEPKFDPTKGHGHRYTNESKSSTRHFLLASVANQNFQLCYEALNHMRTHWGGIRYILTALDQKSEGITDCETYTREEYESTKVARRHSSINRFGVLPEPSGGSPAPTGPPLAWSLTGTTNSPNSSLTLLFPPTNNAAAQMAGMQAAQPPPAPVSAPTPPGNMIYDPIRQSLPETTQMYPPAYPQPNTSALRHSVNPSRHRPISSSSAQNKSHLRYDGLSSDDPSRGPSTPEHKLQLALATQSGTISLGPTSYTPSSQQSSAYDASSAYATGASPSSALNDTHPSSNANHGRSQMTNGNHSGHTPGGGTYASDVGPSNFAQSGSGMASSGYSFLSPAGQNMELITIDNTADITHHLAGFEPTDMMSWLGDYFPNDVLDFTTL